MPAVVPTMQRVSPTAPSPYERPVEVPAPAAPERSFYVLLAGGVWGPVSSSQLAEIAESTYALTAGEVVVTPA